MNAEDGTSFLYMLDKHELYRTEHAASGVPETEFAIAHGLPADASYRIGFELLPDRIIVRNASDGKTLDSLPLAKFPDEEGPDLR